MAENDILDAHDDFGPSDSDFSEDGLDSSQMGESDLSPTEPLDPGTPEVVDPETPEVVDPETPEVVDPGTSEVVDPEQPYTISNPDGSEAQAVDVLLEDDTVVTKVDRDGDGFFEQALLDANADQQVDVMLHYEEGQPEPVAMQVDRNTNGLFRTTWLLEENQVIYSDKEGNVKWISEGEAPPRPFQFVYDAVAPGGEQPPAYPDSGSDTLDDQPPLTPDGQPGDADVELQYWEYQEENGLCVPTSVTMILSEFGIDASRTQVVERAVELNLMTEGGNQKFGRWSGMSAAGAEQLLANYGIESDVYNGSIENLDAFLEEKRDIMVTVDGHEVWKDQPDLGRDPNHMLVVTNIEGGIVTLNDPGNPSGAGFEMSLVDFEKAWADGNNEMVVTEPVPASQHISLAGAEAQKGAPVLLPIVLRATLGAEGETSAEIFDETGEGTPDTIRLPEGTTLRMDDQGLLISLTSGEPEEASVPPMQTAPETPVTSPDADVSTPPTSGPTSSDTATDSQVLDPSAQDATVPEQNDLAPLPDDPPVRDTPDTGIPSADAYDEAGQRLTEQGMALWHLAFPGEPVPTDAEGSALTPPDMSVAILERMDQVAMSDSDRAQLEAPVQQLSGAWETLLRSAMGG